MFICVEKRNMNHGMLVNCVLEFSRSFTKQNTRETEISPRHQKHANTTTAAGCVMTKWMTKSKK